MHSQPAAAANATESARAPPPGPGPAIMIRRASEQLDTDSDLALETAPGRDSESLGAASSLSARGAMSRPGATARGPPAPRRPPGTRAASESRSRVPIARPASEPLCLTEYCDKAATESRLKFWSCRAAALLSNLGPTKNLSHWSGATRSDPSFVWSEKAPIFRILCKQLESICHPNVL